MTNDNIIQSELVKVVESAVPLGPIGGVKENESEHVFNSFDSIIERTTKARSGACFSKLKKEHVSRNSKGEVMIKSLFVGI